MQEALVWNSVNRLPKHVDTDAISASYDAGVLSVRVTGAYAAKQAQRIAIASAQPAEDTDKD